MCACRPLIQKNMQMTIATGLVCKTDSSDPSNTLNLATLLFATRRKKSLSAFSDDQLVRESIKDRKRIKDKAFDMF